MQTLAITAAPARVAVLGTLLLAICCSSGCVVIGALQDYAAYNDNTNDFVMGWRNSVWAREAWHAQKGQFVGHPQFRAFGEGFRAGYISVASGGNGCPPALPPRWYWSWRYQNPEGHAQVAAWYEGFPYGARAADMDGAGLYQQIQVSAPMQKQYTPEYLDPSLPQQSPTPATAPPTSAPGPAFENINTPPGQPFLGPPADALGALRPEPASVVVPASYRLPVGNDSLATGPLSNGPAAAGAPAMPGPSANSPAVNPPPVDRPAMIEPAVNSPFLNRPPVSGSPMSVQPPAATSPQNSNGIATPGMPSTSPLPTSGVSRLTRSEWFLNHSRAAADSESPSGPAPLACLLPPATSWPGQ